jgi:hypothetical protein
LPHHLRSSLDLRPVPRPRPSRDHDRNGLSATAAGNQWYATGAAGTTIGCTQATPCSFAVLKSRIPNAVVSLSLGINKGRDTPFIGAVDGLQVNNAVYDFEPDGVHQRPPQPRS